MRKTSHLCLASHDEVMFRSEEDYIRGFNAFACAVVATESRALADSIMSDHVHFGVQTDAPKEVIGQSRYSYTRYFNSKYHRKGPIGEADPFVSELVGLKHTLAALSYIFRQGLHHGLSSTPFGYRHSSVNVIFKEELGKWSDEKILPDKSRYKYMPRAYDCDMSGYRMSSNGLFLREDIIDKSYVEELFISPRNFSFYMNRLSGEEWEKEQIEEDDTIDIVNLKSVEKHTTVEMIAKMIENERGRIDKWRMTDAELCGIIDNEYIPKYHRGKATIYELTDSQRADLGNRIYDDFRKLWRNPSLKGHQKTFTISQLRRCLAIR